MESFDFSEIVIIQFNVENKQILKDQLSRQRIQYQQNDELNTIQIQIDRKKCIRLSQLIILQERQRLKINFSTKIQIMIAILNKFLKLDGYGLIADDIDLFDIWIKFTNNIQEIVISAYITKFVKNKNNQIVYGRLRQKLIEIINKLFLQTEINRPLQQILNNINQGDSFKELESNFRLISSMDENYYQVIFNIKNQEKIKAFYQKLSNYYDNYLDYTSALQFKQLIINKIIEDADQNIQNILSSSNNDFPERLTINQDLLTFHKNNLKKVTYKSLDDFFSQAQTSQQIQKLSGLERFSQSTLRIIIGEINNENEKLKKLDQTIENVFNYYQFETRFTQIYLNQIKNLFNQQLIARKKAIKQQIQMDSNQNIDFDKFESEIKILLQQIIKQEIETLIQSLE